MTNPNKRLNFTIGLERRPKYSFVIPVYNRTHVVYQAIKSCLNQTFEDFEVVIVLDGSPDETRDIVESIKDYRIKIYRYNNSFGTACRARNRAILEAKGEYICLLDSDDISSPRRLEYLEEILESNSENVDVMYGAIKFITETMRIEGINFGDTAYPNPNGFSLDDLKKSNQIYTLSAAIKRDKLLRYGGFRVDLKYREDYELWLRLKYHGCTFRFTDKVLALYRIHSDNNEINFKKDDQFYHSESLRLYKNQFDNWGV